MEASARHLAFHGAVVLLVGLLCGAPYARAVNRNAAADVVHSWRVAHASLPIGAMLMFAVAALLSSFAIWQASPDHGRRLIGNVAQQRPDEPGLAELVARVTGRAPQNLTPAANLENELGLSSLERVDLLGALEDRYQVDLSETKFASAATVGDLEKLLQGGRDERRDFHYPRWALRWPVTWIRVTAHYMLVRPAVFLLGWPRMMGRENLRGIHGPVLVISNHIDDVDVGFIQTILPARLRHRLATATGGEALEALRSPAADRSWIGRLFDHTEWTLGIALLNLFPLPRQAGFRKSFAYAGEAVDRGYSLLVFPEGRHTEDGRLLPFRSGIGLLANNLRIPVVPMRIDGLFEVKKAGRKFAPPGKIRVRIGKPVEFAPERDPEEIARELEEIVRGL